MELGTFGAILSFAIDREDQAARFYSAVACGGSVQLCVELARGSGKRRRRLVRARQELVSEMVLESITGLDSDTYLVDLQPREGEGEVLVQATALETSTAAYYRAAAAKMPIREVVRLFERLARESELRRSRVQDCLRELGG
jgi:hypothetical protein